MTGHTYEGLAILPVKRRPRVVSLARRVRRASLATLIPVQIYHRRTNDSVSNP
jgi:hypothetical protein